LNTHFLLKNHPGLRAGSYNEKRNESTLIATKNDAFVATLFAIAVGELIQTKGQKDVAS